MNDLNLGNGSQKGKQKLMIKNKKRADLNQTKKKRERDQLVL